MATDDASTTERTTHAANDVDLLPTEAFDDHSPADPTSIPQSDPIEPRPYVEIRPSAQPVDPRAVARSMALLEATLRETTQTGLKHKLRGTTIQPIIEWLLVSDGHDDPTVRYLVGSNVSDLTEDIEGILRTCFPNTYEFHIVSYHPRFIEEFLPVVQTGPPPDRPITDPADRDGPHHPAITPTTPYVAGVEYLGLATRSRDWQTPFEPFETFTGPRRRPDRPADSRRVPLAVLLESIRDAGCPVIFQVVVRPYRDWSKDAKMHRIDLDEGTVTLGDKIVETIFSRTREERQQYNPPADDQRRIDGIDSRDPSRTLAVSARAVVLTRSSPSRANAVARRLTTAFAHVSGRDHRLIARVNTDDELYDGIGHPPGAAVYQDLISRTGYGVNYSRVGDRLRRRPHESRGIVLTPEELACFCVVDGGGLTPSGARAIAARPTERSGLPLPPPAQLARYAPPGMALGMPLTHDRQPYGRPFVLPPALQDRHVIVAGDTGAGKSVLVETAMLTNVVATDGPAICFDLKGGDTAREYCQAHFAAFGSLEDVYYFDCTRVLPALAVFDIEPLLEAGIPREEARSRKAGHYEEIVRGVMGAEQYARAVESPKLIRNHLRALFDPIHGADALSHADLVSALQHTLGQGETPPVSDDALADYFASLLERDRDVFNRAVGGALSRVETIATDGRLAPLFNHVPYADEANDHEHEDGPHPHFDFADVLEEDCVLIFDLGGMEAAAKRALTLAILSALWTALRASAEAGADHPPVNCYLEDAKDVAETHLVETLLAQGRSFGLSVTLGVQYPGQLDSPNPQTDTYREALNETATFVVGNVAVDDDLAKVFATDDMPARAVDRRLSRLPRGEWLCRPGTAFGEQTPRPFLLTSLPPPPGHPASTDPLDAAERAAFEATFEEVLERTKREYGLDQSASIPAEPDEPESTADADEADEDTTAPIDLAYAYTRRMPEPVYFNKQTTAIHCRACDNRYDPQIEGMIRGIECCHSIADVDRDDIPVGPLNLKRSPEEVTKSPYSAAQLRMLQAVYNGTQGRTHPLEYDLLRDSMLRLQEYVGIDPEEVQELLEEGLLRQDDHPFRLYTVTPEGRAAIGESYREGVDYGHGKGDLEESSKHVMGVRCGARWVEAEFQDDPDSEVVRVERYYDIGGNQRLDVVGLDENDEVVLTVEVERVNHDVRRAVPEDFDKMAACGPAEAIWIAMSHTEAHTILSALNDPLEGEPRVSKTYSEGTPANDFLIDEPGFTGMYTLDQIRDRLDLD